MINFFQFYLPNNIYQTGPRFSFSGGPDPLDPNLTTSATTTCCAMVLISDGRS